MNKSNSQIKILHIINSLYSGGAEKLLVDAVLKYNEKDLGSDVLVLNTRRSYLYDTLANMSGINVIHSSENSSVYSLQHIGTIKKLLPNYDIIHVHLFPSLYWVAIANIFSTKSSAKLILTEHSTNNKRRNNWFYRRIDRYLYKQFNYIVTISESAEKNLKKHLGPSFNNITTINNGVDLKLIEDAIPYPKSEFGLRANDFVLIQVSGFRYPKDQITVIKALNLLPDNIHLFLVGDGIELQPCKDFAIANELTSRIHFLGLRSDVPRLLKTADIAILSSEYEGLSLASVEGLASGSPFVATDVPGLREVVENSGLLFPFGDHAMLAELVLKLFKDKSFYQKTVENCLQRAKHYDILKMVNSYIALYKEALTEDEKTY